MQAHYIILEDRIILSTKHYASWRQVQAEYPGYVSSLGPWTKADLLDYLQNDFSDETHWPITRDYIDKTYS